MGLLSFTIFLSQLKSRKTHPCMGLFCPFVLLANLIQADDAILDRPVAICVSADGEFVFIGNQRGSSLTVVEMRTLGVTQVAGDWNTLTDVTISPSTGQLLVVSDNPPQITELTLASGVTQETNTSELPGIPAKVAMSQDGGYVCITMTWKHAVYLIELVNGKLPTSPSEQILSGRLIPLGFQPKELLSLSDGRFLVADAFGRNLAVVDSKQSSVVAMDKVIGHHIGGLALDASTQTIAISHQRLSANARTTRDDIHWGLLMQNMVSVFPESLLSDPTKSIARSSVTLMLGDVGRGAADPSGLVAWDGCLAVAITGTGEIAYKKNGDRHFLFTDVKQSPSRVVRISDTKMMWINPFGNTVTITNLVNDPFGETIVVTGSLGTESVPATAEERGEAAFFSSRLSHDGWMSCSSCHVDGHSPDLLADTKGDGRYDNAKRIPSLFNVAHTGPWAWNGSEAKLEDQVTKTIATSMHRDSSSPETGASDRALAQDIVAYLSKLQLPSEPVEDTAKRQQGHAFFESRGCTTCHKPESHYTSSETYDVNVVDELGQTKFNPPSLKGLRYRRAYFHDARYKSLEKLIPNHPDSKSTWTQTELTALEAYLMSL
jgi:cytochrome c peroxidase/DNA-binding beta-propeller fold protein YncE